MNDSILYIISKSSELLFTALASGTIHIKTLDENNIYSDYLDWLFNLIKSGRNEDYIYFKSDIYFYNLEKNIDLKHDEIEAIFFLKHITKYLVLGDVDNFLDMLTSFFDTRDYFRIAYSNLSQYYQK